MYIKEGDKSREVSEVQKILSLLGYDLIIDGHFGSKTTRSVRSFQKKSGLTVDGVVGNNTFNALKASLKRGAKESGGAVEKEYYNLDIVKHHLDSSQYIKQKFPKKQVYIHFTAGGPSAKSTISWWDSNEPRIATSYVIDGGPEATIFEAFHPDYWSYHLGIKGTRGKLDKHSIGIEICNWGNLEKKNGKFYSWPAKQYNDYSKKYEVDESEVFELDTPHRGFKYYHKCSSAQIKNLEKLLLFLIDEYDIPLMDCYDLSWFEFQDHVIKNMTPGIWTHVNVRKDKYDMAPQKELIDMLNDLNEKI